MNQQIEQRRQAENLERQNKMQQERSENERDNRLRQEHDIMMAQRKGMEIGKIEQFNKQQSMIKRHNVETQKAS